MTGALAANLTRLLRTTRKSDGSLWTGRELAAAINADGDVAISESYLSSLKSGARTNPAHDVIRALAKALGVREGDLIEDVTPTSIAELGLPISAEQVSLLDRVAQAFVEAQSLAGDELPDFKPQRRLEIEDLYTANEVATELEKRAEWIRSEFGDATFAGMFDQLAARLRDAFTLAAEDKRANKR